LIAVDNGSSDRTGEIIRDLEANHDSVVYHRVEQNEGYGAGVLSGFPLCRAPWVGAIPADEQVDPEDVVRLYEAAAMTDGRVVVKVRRRFRMDGLRRKMISIAYNLLVRLLWPSMQTLDVNGSPKIMRRELVEALHLRSKDWFLDPEIMIKANHLGFRVLELNVLARLRSAGISHVHTGTCWEFLTNLLRYRLSDGWKSELATVTFDSSTVSV
jgi:glycosyltransferase involved in cell wall biosynthesis